MNTILQTKMKAAQSSSFTPAQTWLLQRKCAGDECPERSKKRLTLQRNSSNQTEPSEVPPIVHKVLFSSGQPLDTETRAFMEPRFGHDFSKVRVHADSKAAESARAVNALAYTVGQNVVFGTGQFAPGTGEGRKLLAHELTHTIQQGNVMPYTAGMLKVTSPEAPTEHEADRVSSGAVIGQSTVVRDGEPARIARQLNPGTKDAGKTDTEALDAGKITNGPPDSGVPAEVEAKSSCPVKKVGTLSEVSWGETSGIYPTKNNLYQPDKWDQAKTCELLKARAAVHEVGKRGQSVNKSKPGTGNIEQLLKPYHFIENFPSVDTEISDKSVKWFYLGKNPDKPDVHPGTTGTERVKSYGSFYNIGGGDAPKGDIYIHFYRLKTSSAPVQ